MVWELNGSSNCINNPAENNIGDFPCTISLEKLLSRNGLFPVFGVQSVRWSKYLVHGMEYE